jgi:hypothetical protein
MGMNDKSFRLRGLRDRLHLTGRNAPTFNQSIDIIIEVLGMIHSPRNLSWSRREAAKLRDRNPEMSVEQLQRFALLEDRLFKKGELIKARLDKKKGKDPKKRGPQPTPQPAAPGAVDIWDV